MKVLLFNGSPRKNGCTFTALTEISAELATQGIDSEIIQMGNGVIRDCIACGGCASKGRCVFDDDPINEWVEKAVLADGFVFGTPVYYAHPTGRILSAMDRMFYSGGEAFAFKPAAAIASARRSGALPAFDDINKYFMIKRMPVVSSTYWNNVFGSNAGEVVLDEEGMQTMRNLARNMAWLIKVIDLGKKNGIEPPANELLAHTNFIR